MHYVVSVLIDKGYVMCVHMIWPFLLVLCLSIRVISLID